MSKLIKIIAIVMFFCINANAQEVYVLDENDMSKAITKEFVEQGMDEEVELEFFGGKTSFTLPSVNMAKVMITNLKVDEDGNKFSAQAEIFGDGVSFEKTFLQGKYYTKMMAYVPNIDIKKGELITKDKLKSTQIRANRIKNTHVFDKNKLVGLQAKRSLNAGELIFEREVGAETLIKKGDIVTAIYKVRGLQITSKVEAQENGAKNQRIELINTKSGKKVNAKVIDAITVEINNE